MSLNGPFPRMPLGTNFGIDGDPGKGIGKDRRVWIKMPVGKLTYIPQGGEGTEQGKLIDWLTPYQEDPCDSCY